MAKILLVEDNEMNRDMMVRRLQHEGHTVVAAANGREAIELAEKEKPDLILMDISLPEMDGWEATRELKNRAETQQIPIIALTAHATHEDRVKSMEAGADAFETKPFRMPRLSAKIEKLLEDNPDLRDRYQKD
ncbi:MAG: response regulator [Chloroflexi bacterium]|nr:response regulator [Chloroflexota bacterium]